MRADVRGPLQCWSFIAPVALGASINRRGWFFHGSRRKIAGRVAGTGTQSGAAYGGPTIRRSAGRAQAARWCAASRPVKNQRVRRVADRMGRRIVGTTLPHPGTAVCHRGGAMPNPVALLPHPTGAMRHPGGATSHRSIRLLFEAWNPRGLLILVPSRLSDLGCFPRKMVVFDHQNTLPKNKNALAGIIERRI